MMIFRVPMDFFPFFSIPFLPLFFHLRQVTVLSPDEDKHPIPNRTTYTMETAYEDRDYEEKSLEDIRSFWLGGATHMYEAIWDWNEYNCKKQFKSEGWKRLMRNFVQRAPKVDLIIKEAAGMWVSYLICVLIQKFGIKI